MAIETHRISVGGLTVEVVRKDIKNLHMGVYPPGGRIRVAVPLTVSDNAVRLAVVGKLGWIKRQRARFTAQPRQSEREMVSGESHYFLGRRFRLRVIKDADVSAVLIRNRSTLELRVRSGASAEQRERVLHRWYRNQLHSLIPGFLEKWQTALKVKVSGYQIRKMRTRWGTCNENSGRILLNLELARKPPRCIEYIVAHEVMHLVERNHNDRFRALLDRHFPDWRQIRAELSQMPLSHQAWPRENLIPCESDGRRKQAQ